MAHSTTGSTRTKSAQNPPISNTGVLIEAVRADWLDLTVPCEDLPAAFDLWRSHDLGESAIGPGGLHYSGALTGSQGLRLAYGGRGSAAGLGTLRLPGTFWRFVPDPDGFLRGLLGLPGARPSRVDLAADFDGPGLPSVRDLADAFRADHNRMWTRARQARLIEDLRTGLSTMYIGSPAGERMVRIYDMRGPLRIELQTRQDASRRLAGELDRLSVHLAWWLGVTGFVGFRGVPGWDALTSANPDPGEQAVKPRYTSLGRTAWA